MKALQYVSSETLRCFVDFHILSQTTEKQHCLIIGRADFSHKSLELRTIPGIWLMLKQHLFIFYVLSTVVRTHSYSNPIQTLQLS